MWSFKTQKGMAPAIPYFFAGRKVAAGDLEGRVHLKVDATRLQVRSLWRVGRSDYPDFLEERGRMRPAGG